MIDRAISEELFEQLCLASEVSCEPVAPRAWRTPDFRIWLGDVQVICEVKQINPNAEDRADLEYSDSGEAVGRLVRNRMRATLKDVSAAQSRVRGRLSDSSRSLRQHAAQDIHPSFRGGPGDVRRGQREGQCFRKPWPSDDGIRTVLRRQSQFYTEPKYLRERSCDSRWRPWLSFGFAHLPQPVRSRGFAPRSSRASSSDAVLATGGNKGDAVKQACRLTRFAASGWRNNKSLRLKPGRWVLDGQRRNVVTVRRLYYRIVGGET
jgi:hypothetical protein